MRRFDGNRVALFEPNGRVRLAPQHTVGTTTKGVAMGVGFHRPKKGVSHHVALKSG